MWDFAPSHEAPYKSAETTFSISLLLFSIYLFSCYTNNFVCQTFTNLRLTRDSGKLGNQTDVQNKSHQDGTIFSLFNVVSGGMVSHPRA
jgi:hypothetical protein